MERKMFPELFSGKGEEVFIVEVNRADSLSINFSFGSLLLEKEPQQLFPVLIESSGGTTVKG